MGERERALEMNDCEAISQSIFRRCVLYSFIFGAEKNRQFKFKLFVSVGNFFLPVQLDTHTHTWRLSLA